MSFAARIRACNNFDRTRVIPLYAGARRIGWLRRDNAVALAPFRRVFRIDSERAELVADGDVDAVSAAVDEVVDALVRDNRVPKWRYEVFDVAPRWGEAPVFRVDRGAVPFFGVRAYGVDLNGYRRDSDGIKLWVGRRAADKRLAPNKLDNLVGGGIGSGYGAGDTLVKEADEEAGIPTHLVARAVPVGAVTYLMENEVGIRDGVLFVYDVELPADFVPHNRDGEVVEFHLLPARAIIERIRTTDDFKFDVNLVMLDFALRHGLIPIDDPEYLAVASGLHRPLD